ncbi:MAG: 50S ribosomal protein L44e [Candidatus Altiarchaeota archaeon]|nr:50S ribosomal protein L44e [Candidatus Altiarchaeota archaeon]
MKVPGEVNKFCRKCKKHTKHTVKRESKGKASSLSWGQRQYARVKEGHGSKRRGEKEVLKVNKGGNLVFTCSQCGKKSLKAYDRTKKEPQIEK